MMQAVVLHEFGPPSHLVPAVVAEPPAGAGGAVIAVDFASITFVETQVRAGRPPLASMAPVLPVILGNGVGGTVTSVGAGADPALAGRHVVATTGGSGGYAEHVAVRATDLIEVPPQVSMRDAVALLADGRTAVALISAAGVQPGDTVLVEAAAGGVGTLLVQLARSAGATVIAAAGGPRKTELAASLGAQLTVDYGAPDWPALVRSAAGGVDVVLDGVGGVIAEAAFGLLREGGRCVSFGMASGTFAAISADAAARRGITMIRGVPVQPDQLRRLTSTALAAAAAGSLRPVVGQVFPLAHAAAAHAAIEARATMGKTLLTTT